MRGVAQKCPQKMKNLITFGTPHQGINGLPDYLCGWNVIYIYFHNVCTYAKKLFNYFAYKDLIQNTVVQAQFWHNPFNDDLYTKKSKFLADINNDRYYYYFMIFEKKLLYIVFLLNTKFSPEKFQIKPTNQTYSI